MDEAAQEGCLCVIEKVMEENSELKPAFRNIVECFLECEVFSTETLEKWKTNEDPYFNTLLNGEIHIDADLHRELVNSLNV